MKTKLLFLTAFIIMLQTTIAQTIAIPDPNFEQALIDLGIDTNGLNGNILQSQANAVNALNVVGKNISSLQGIEGFPNIVSLYVNQNALTTLDVSNNTSLVDLQCGNNQLTSLILGNLINLQTLICENNQLTNFNVSNSPALEYLYCFDNQLSNLNVTNNTLLKYLICDGNDLTTLNLANNTNLKILDCFSNQLETLDLSNNTLLEDIDCNNNQITNLIVNNNPALTELVCHTNQITNIDVSNSPNLTHFRVNNNQLTNLNLKNGNNINISVFNAENNPNLTCIQVDNATYSNETWSDYIDSQTSFNQSCPTIAIPDANFEQALIDLGYDTNGLTGDILQGEAEAVSTLDVSNQNISSLQGIEGFVNLLLLSCYDNSLSSLDVSNNPLLGTLDCSNNQLNQLILNNSYLTSLNCRDNNLLNLNTENSTLLRNLNCFNNNLNFLDLTNNSAIDFLLADNNQLVSLNVKNGNNTNVNFFSAIGNPNLTCVEVDDETYSTNNWTFIDAQTGFSEDCNYPELIAIPDANFEQALIDLGYDTNGLSGTILKSEAEAVTSLDVSYKSINSLQGIEGFINLEILNCYTNFLSNLDITNLAALRELNCDENSLTILDLSQNVNLNFLNCNSNPLTSLDVSQNIALERLNCVETQITTLDVSLNPNLTELISSLNPQLTSINLRNGNNTSVTTFSAIENPNLTCIEVDDAAYSTTNWTNIDSHTSFSEDCSQVILIPDANFEQALIYLGYDTNGLTGDILKSEAEAVTSLNLSNKNISSLEGIEAFINVTSLKVNSNNLTTLNVSSNILLTELYCGHNELTSLDLQSNVVLVEFGCWNNQISILDLSSNTVLDYFNAEGNGLLNLNIKNGNNMSLSYFYVEDNPNLLCVEVDDPVYSTTNWTFIDAQTGFSEDCNYPELIAIPDANFEQALIDLGYDTNGLNGNIFKYEAEAVTILEVNNENINSLQGIEGFVNVETLNVEANNITAIDISNNVLLKFFSCAYNYIEELDLSNNVALLQVEAYHNFIANIDVSNNVALEALVISENQLTTLDVSNNTNIQTLVCSDNLLTNLDVSNNTNLQGLVCSNNQLTSLDLSNNPFLILAHLSDNELISLNIKNGNNLNILEFTANNNPNLSCIEVDDAIYSTTNWTNVNAQTSFSEDCGATLGIEEVLLDTISLYPNPSSDVFYVKGLQEDSQIKVYDINGRVILTTVVVNNQSINVSNLPKGLYLVNISNTQGQTTKKLIIK